MRALEQTVYQYPAVVERDSYFDAERSWGAPYASPTHSILVTLKYGNDRRLPPFFVIASAGGTPDAYAKLAMALKTRRDIIGVRDPFILDERETTMGLQRWVALYVQAIRERQPEGPYYVGAYSSGGALGYEIAQQLRRDGQDVALLVLIDPVGIDRQTRRHFGHWVLDARFRWRPFRWAVRMVGWLRLPIVRWRRGVDRSVRPNDGVLTTEQFARRAAACTRNANEIIGFSIMLELNTGLPVALTQAELSRVAPDEYLSVLLARVEEAAPDIEPAAIERILLQYYCLQIPAQQGYRLDHYDGPAVLFEPAGPHAGLVSAVFRPYVRRLRVRRLKLGEQSGRMRSLAQGLPLGLRLHYLSMRDDTFVQSLAGELETLLQ